MRIALAGLLALATALLSLAGCASPAPMPGPPAFAPDHTVHARSEIATSERSVYQAFTTGHGLESWLADRATTHPVEGGELWIGFRDEDDIERAARGVFLALLPDRRVTVRLVYPQEIGEALGLPLPSFVVHETDVVIGGEGSGRVTVDIDDRIDASAPLAYVTQVRRLWSSALANLRSVLETGRDLRPKKVAEHSQWETPGGP